DDIENDSSEVIRPKTTNKSGPNQAATDSALRTHASGASAIQKISTGIGRLPVSLLAVICLVVLCLVTIWFVQQRRLSRPNPRQMLFTRLTIEHNIKEAAISLDGKYVGSITDEAGEQSVALRQISSGSDLQLVASSPARYKGLAFSPDGEYIYYLK